MEFVAFKALRRDGDMLYSPSLHTPWMYDLQGRPCLVADSMDGFHGVYAASWKEAAEYGEEIYMVVPYLLSGGDPEIALGTSGWRSSAATVIAGPWRRKSRKGMRLAAEFILASYMQGYRQIWGILLWAADLLGFPALNILEQAIDDDNPVGRIWAVTVAGKMKLPALYILERAMGDGDSAVRQRAVYEAGKMGLPALRILERAMDDADPTIRTQAVYEAGGMGISALRILERAINDSHPDVRWAAVRWAVEIGLPAIHIVERAMGDEDPNVRRYAVREAVKLGLLVRTKS